MLGCYAPKWQCNGKQEGSNTKFIRGSELKFATGKACKILKRRHVIPRSQRKSAATGADLKSPTLKRQFSCQDAGKKHRVKPAICGVTMKSPWNTSALPPHAADTLDMVGSAQESNMIHAKRHPLAQIRQWAKVCARCAFILWRREGRGRSTCAPWIAPKPSFMSGAWGLGCSWCAAAKTSPAVQQCRRIHMQENRAVGRCKQAISRSAAWSGYEHRLTARRRFNERIAEHECGDLHRLSQKVFFSPQGHLNDFRDPRGDAAFRTAQDSYSLSGLPCTFATVKAAGAVQLVTNPVQSQPVAASVQPFATRVGSASDPFRGNVPQCQDWLDTWADLSSAVSMQGLV